MAKKTSSPTEKPPTLYKAVALHILDCTPRLGEMPQWLTDSLERLGDAFNRHGASQSANVDRDAVGRKPSDKRAQIRLDLIAGKTQTWIRENRKVGDGVIVAVRAELRAETPAEKAPAKKAGKKGKK